MLIIQGVLISEEIIDTHFVCDLQACKGACCWEGDLGAPLQEEELPVMEEIYEQVRPFLTSEGRAAIELEGPFVYDPAEKAFSTPLINGGPCAYMTRDDKGIARCGIEEAHRAGATAFKKPISCHLYPIRVAENREQGFEALNYDRWDICTAACELGKKARIPIYEFVREALIRKYGTAFYEELEAAAQHLKKR